MHHYYHFQSISNLFHSHQSPNSKVLLFIFNTVCPSSILDDMSVVSSCIVLWQMENTPFCYLNLYFIFFEGLSVFCYNKEALNDFFFVATCSQRSKIPFCPHYSRNWTVTSPNFPSPLVFRHSYRNIIDFSWHLQSMSICLVMAVNICFDAALDPAAQGSPHEHRFSKSAGHLLVSMCKNTAVLEGLLM